MLSEFVDAFMARDDKQLAVARQKLVDAMGAASMVEAAAVACNFQRMVRIADSIGISVDEVRFEQTVEIREQLGLNDFESARNTFER